MKSVKSWLPGSIFFLATSMWAAVPAHPGMLNYVEGRASIGGQAITSSSVGSAEVSEGQRIETGQGKAEILLTPGVFLRLGDNSSVRMDSAGLTNTRVAVLSGRVMVEADNLQKENDIQIVQNGAISRLEKDGIYRFSSNPPEVATFDGKLRVTENDQSAELGKGHAALLNEPLKSTKFDRKADEKDPLYQWSKVRSEYLAESSVATARTLVVDNSGWYGGGWYWNPWYASYSWIPGGGMFWNPFGFGFYSPYSVWAAPAYSYYGFHRGVAPIRGVVRPGFRGAGVHPGFRTSGFGRSSMGGMHSSRGGFGRR